MNETRGVLARKAAETIAALEQHYSGAELARLKQALGVFSGLVPGTPSPDPLERPGFAFPGLGGRAWFDPKEFHEAAVIEAAAPTIREELAACLHAGGPFSVYQEGLEPNPPRQGVWASLTLKQVQVTNEGKKFFPRTIELLSGLDLGPLALISALNPGSHIKPHCGSVNVRLIAHLGLIVPADCWLRAGRDCRWTSTSSWCSMTGSSTKPATTARRPGSSC